MSLVSLIKVTGVDVFGMLRRIVQYVYTDVSEVLAASVIKSR
jgi:hypothetical protein